uniref:Ribose 5-phosphate isomerase, type A n=1 Tax=Tanacetum cinerariifolium TaxID=118510 RepID=A0A699GY27_TANCI|nr:ribose 5-phosphate isomerase, type A [Tanacetum cinerariifolium]
MDMQTTRQAIKNTNHPSSALKASFGPYFPYNMPQNSSSSHMQTTRQVINNTNHLSSLFQPAIRPSFLYDMHQNSSSSSSSLQASVGPDVHQNSSSSSSSSRSQSLQSQPTVHEPTLYQSSSSNSIVKFSVVYHRATEYIIRDELSKSVSNDRLLDNKREPNDFESFHLCYKTKDDTYLQEATRDMMVIANLEISSKEKELVGPEGIAEDAVVAKIAREVINKLLGNEEPHCYGAGVTKSQIFKFCCGLKRMRSEGLADENRFLKEKNKKVESYKKQVETQGLQMKNIDQKLNEVYGMLKLLHAFPNLDNVASTSAAGTCDKQELDEDKCLKLEDKRPKLLDWLKTNV